jgi:DNA sulfur modification protein DndE
MKDIPAEAILFDMYYMAKDPVVLVGDKREAPKVELFPVTEATPRFRDFHISNVVCYGAAKAVFIRGLPEMAISDIFIQDVVIKADKAGDVISGNNISLNHVKLITSDSGKINVQDSKGVKQ